MSDDDVIGECIADKSVRAIAKAQRTPHRRGSPTRLPLRWPRPTDKKRLTMRQQIAFNILEADGRFAHCGSATEMLNVMPLASMVRLLIKPRWPRNFIDQHAEGGPLGRDALKDALYKYFPDNAIQAE